MNSDKNPFEITLAVVNGEWLSTKATEPFHKQHILFTFQASDINTISRKITWLYSE